MRNEIPEVGCEVHVTANRTGAHVGTVVEVCRGMYLVQCADGKYAFDYTNDWRYTSDG